MVNLKTHSVKIKIIWLHSYIALISLLGIKKKKKEKNLLCDSFIKHPN